MTFVGAVVWAMAGSGKWAFLFAFTAAATVVLHDRFHSVAAEPARKRVNLARVHGPSWVETCAYCRQPAETWDHIVPFSRGGSDERWNMAPACTRCNGAKSGRTPEEFWKVIGHGRPFPSFWPRSGVE